MTGWSPPLLIFLLWTGLIKISFEAVLADSFGEKFDFIDSEIGFHTFWERDVFFAGGLLADLAVEMEMPVIVCFLVAVVMEQFEYCGCIFLNADENYFFF